MQSIRKALFALAALAALSFCSPCGAQSFSLIQSTSNFTFSSSTSATYGSNTTAGHLLVAFVVVNTGGASGATVHDSSNGNWTFAIGGNAAGIFYVCSAVGGVAPTVTVSGGGGNWYAIHLMEFSGNLTSSCLDQDGQAAWSGSTSITMTIASGSLATSDLLVAGAEAIGGGPTYTPGSGETSVQFVNGSFGLSSNSFYNNAVLSSGTPSMTATTSPSSSGFTAIAAFKLAGPAAQPSRHRIIESYHHSGERLLFYLAVVDPRRSRPREHLPPCDEWEKECLPHRRYALA